MRKILEQIIFKSLFEDTTKTVIKQAPRSVVDKARSLKGYAFRIQSTRTGGTVDTQTLIKKIRINDQYGEDSYTNNEKWVYIFGPDLRDAERKFFCNVLILPIAAATKLYDLDNIEPAQLGTIGEAPIYRENEMIKPTRGQKIDQRANNAVTIVKSVLSNEEPTKDIITPGLELNNTDFFDGEEGVDWKTVDGISYRWNYMDDGTGYWEKIDPTKKYAPINAIGQKKSKGKIPGKDAEIPGKDAEVIGDDGAEVISDENTIKIPSGGFKYGIRDNKEFAKLQQYLIDLSKTPAGKAQFKAYVDSSLTAEVAADIMKELDKFIAYGADGKFLLNAQKIISWWYITLAPPSVTLDKFLDVITVDIANVLLKDQTKIKVIAESRLSYKPKYMTIIQSKILQEQLKTSYGKKSFS